MSRQWNPYFYNLIEVFFFFFLIIYSFIYLFTITLLTEKKKIQYITYTTYDPILQFLHGTREKEKKKNRKRGYLKSIK